MRTSPRTSALILLILAMQAFGSYALAAGPLPGQQTTVSGHLNGTQENACIHMTPFVFGADCTYARSLPELAGVELPWVGPTVNPVYFARDSKHANPDYIPKPGDDRIAPTLDGVIAVDDRGTPDPLDDQLSARLVVGPAARSVVTNVNELRGGVAGAPPRAVQKWDSLTHTVAPVTVNFAEPNEHGGFDYVVGEQGFPTLICMKNDPEDCFTSENAPTTVGGMGHAGRWKEPGSLPNVRNEALGGIHGGNPGTVSIGEFKGMTCEDNRGGAACKDGIVVWDTEGKGEDSSWDNLLLKVSTDSEAKVVEAAGFWTNEYYIPGVPANFELSEQEHNNSWQGGYLTVKGVAK
ncbi:MAG: hypothetical protein QF803_07530 [Gammaproteobacteria bacterium]|nr:hypothetical protein [Gammaproteobacteria bacterium]